MATLLRALLLLAAIVFPAVVAATEIVVLRPSAYLAESLPTTVEGIARTGTTSIATAVTLKDRRGDLHRDAASAVATLESAAWSPDDPERDGAGEFEVLLCTARLVRDHPLPGIVSIGNRHGALLGPTEDALRRSVFYGVPVVRVARNGQVSGQPDDLLLNGRELSAAEAQRILATCLVRFGALPPAANPARPTAKERAAIERKLAVYQRTFDLQAAASRYAALYTSELSAMSALR